MQRKQLPIFSGITMDEVTFCLLYVMQFQFTKDVVEPNLGADDLKLFGSVKFTGILCVHSETTPPGWST